MQKSTLLIASISIFIVNSIAEAQIRYSEIRNFYQYANDNKLIAYYSPHLKKDDIARIIEFSLGSAVLKNRSNDLLVDEAFHCQGIIESIRVTRTSRSQKKFWKIPLRTAENQIALALMNPKGPRDKVAQRLRVDVEGGLKSAVSDYANSIGYRIGQTPCAAAAHKVAFSLNNPRAKVAYMSAGDFILHHYFKDNNNVNFPLPTWTGVDAPRAGVRLYGRFFFKYTHGTNKYVSPDPFLLTKDTVFGCTTSSISPL